MDRRTDRYNFVGVHSLVGLFTQHALNDILHGRNPGRAPNENDFIDGRLVEFGITDRVFNGDAAAVD